MYLFGEMPLERSLAVKIGVYETVRVVTKVPATEIGDGLLSLAHTFALNAQTKLKRKRVSSSLASPLLTPAKRFAHRFVTIDKPIEWIASILSDVRE
jgi:hypothetical protein